MLKWFLAALKQQQYAGRYEKDGVKKPLNAFLGELFLASFEPDAGAKGTTKLISEQVRCVNDVPSMDSDSASASGHPGDPADPVSKPSPACNSMLPLERRTRRPS